MFYIFVLHKIVAYRHFSYFQYGFHNGRQRSRDYSYWFKWKFDILATICESLTAICWTVLEIICVEPIYPQFSGVLQTCLALRYWFLMCLAASVNTFATVDLGMFGICCNLHPISKRAKYEQPLSRNVRGVWFTRCKTDLRILCLGPWLQGRQCAKYEYPRSKMKSHL